MFARLTEYATILSGLAVVFAIFSGGYWVLTNDYVRASHAKTFVSFFDRLAMSSIAEVARIHTAAFQLWLDRSFALSQSARQWSFFRVSIFSSTTLALGLACIFFPSHLITCVLLIIFAIVMSILWEMSNFAFLLSLFLILVFILLDSPLLNLTLSTEFFAWYGLIGFMLFPFASSLLIHSVWLTSLAGKRSITRSICIVLTSYFLIWSAHDYIFWLSSDRLPEWEYAYQKWTMSENPDVMRYITALVIIIVAFGNIVADYASVLITKRLVDEALERWSIGNLYKYLMLDMFGALGLTVSAILSYVVILSVIYIWAPQAFAPGYDPSPDVFCASFGVDRLEQFDCKTAIKASHTWMSFSGMRSFASFEAPFALGGLCIILFSTVGPTMILGSLICFGICLQFAEFAIRRSGALLLRGMHDGGEASRKVQYLLSFGLTTAAFALVTLWSMMVGSGGE